MCVPGMIGRYMSANSPACINIMYDTPCTDDEISSHKLKHLSHELLGKVDLYYSAIFD